MTSPLKVVDGVDDSRNDVVTGSRVTSLAGTTVPWPGRQQVRVDPALCVSGVDVSSEDVVDHR